MPMLDEGILRGADFIGCSEKRGVRPPERAGINRTRLPDWPAGLLESGRGGKVSSAGQYRRRVPSAEPRSRVTRARLLLIRRGKRAYNTRVAFRMSCGAPANSDLPSSLPLM